MFWSLKGSRKLQDLNQFLAGGLLNQFFKNFVIIFVLKGQKIREVLHHEGEFVYF